MEPHTQQKRQSAIMKSLAIVGFIAVIIFIAWASMRLVELTPSAFSSLASLVEGVNQSQGATTDTEVEDTPELSEFTVTSNTRVAASGETVSLNWEEASRPGSYVFSYECADGVSVDLSGVDGLRAIQCDTNYNLGDITALDLSVQSERERFGELAYTISFLRTNELAPSAAGSANFTIVNTEIPEAGLATDDTNDTSEIAMVDEVMNDEAETTPNSSDDTTNTPVANNSQPQFAQEFVYAIPTSDPNGRTDLAVRFLNVGRISNDTFVIAPLREDRSGAIQFEVKNVGTKTSGTWRFELDLPGDNYRSVAQDGLKPNERAVIAISFPVADSGAHTFRAEVDETTDRNSINDRFAQRVSIAN